MNLATVRQVNGTTQAALLDGDQMMLLSHVAETGRDTPEFPTLCAAEAIP